MNLFILDSDILCLFQEGHQEVTLRINQQAPGEVAVSVITVEEQLRGWYTLIRRAKKPPQIALAYEQLTRSVSDLSRLRILTYSEPAIDRFQSLVKGRLGVRANDLRIAVIALEHNATVVTRNVRDFQKIPGLSVEDWSQE